MTRNAPPPSPAASPGEAARARRQSGEFTERERRQARRLTFVLVTIALFFCAELAGAIAADSDVLKADAIHLLMDVVALAGSLAAMRIAVRKPTERFTFGLRRAEPVAAVVNAALVLSATVLIVHEAVVDLGRESAPHAGIMLVVALGALVVNGVSAWLLHGAVEGGVAIASHAHAHGPEHHHAHEAPAGAHDCEHDHAHDHGHEHEHGHAHAHAHEDDHGHAHAPAPDAHAHHGHGHALNLRGALLHLLGDALASLAAVVAALLIRAGFSTKIDPIASLCVAAILAFGALRLLRDAMLVLLESAPAHLPVALVRAIAERTAGVAEVHDLHIWSLGAGHDAITVHVRAESPDVETGPRVERALRDAFGVEYVTVQVEYRPDACAATD